ncbi:MAG: cytochrome C' [Hydrogenophilales bacterium CG03_land_8_20_14_0_80_62_28]|nr:c-type cytochrome [Betaproteobacteria bacterium]OIO77519.1 MAG: hypothetical protein AUJ86_08640 [Hydrogenophilaceae bacterium CG1_02_62_390]PIV22918.1 MAG: cytochrome C' [Hydrogenophilales bacterium CG03_land_8_20_14_0_80_62_28]PIW38030.1 MAG: cytochrome C' [Hydrogenophilales bacterium CG15_BIG_FIL_POST_REV_8_21_14_020_62_31]PIW70843.1 MAG: cytochrome C' [Hydrogenophilales bacterium CG12_big_fil_rev_8_21_14_0_65_61_21]PIX00543.1 MAG: cytochrome C' [Hydrogenophilales bacterium CG_4_8_14_3_u
MKKISAAVAAIALFAAGSALAAGGDELAKKNGCLTCHDVSAKKMGPTFKDIAAKSDKATILTAIEKGSKGKYGKMPMMAQPKAAADAAAIADWIVSLK